MILKIIILDERMKDSYKRGILLFETLFRLSRYDFRFPKYHRVKKR